MTSSLIRATHRLRTTVIVAATAAALTASAFTGIPSATADTASCTRPGMMYHRVPDLRPWIEDLTDYSFATCWPGDTVRILYDSPGYPGTDAYRWYFVEVDGPRWGHRAGWIYGYSLSMPPEDEVIVERPVTLTGPGRP